MAAAACACLVQVRSCRSGRAPIGEGMAWLCSLAFAVCLLVPRDAWAYIDVGAGSLLLQAALASLLAVGYAVKLRWRQLRALLARMQAPRRAQRAEGERSQPGRASDQKAP
jgi:hypothetical protein